jgi:hypothetical protein
MFTPASLRPRRPGLGCRIQVGHPSWRRFGLLAHVFTAANSTDKRPSDRIGHAAENHGIPPWWRLMAMWLEIHHSLHCLSREAIEQREIGGQMHAPWIPFPALPTADCGPADV